MTGSDLVHEISVDLNDQEPGFEYCRWTAFQLGTYVREAIAHLIEDARVASDVASAEWIHTVVVKLDTTHGWQSSCECGCEVILRVNGESTSEGVVINPIPRLDDDEGMLWRGDTPSCDGTVCDYEMLGYIINDYHPCEFKVVPPILDGKDHYVSLECYAPPTTDELYESIPRQWEAPIKQWALYRALIVDSENNSTVTAVAKVHLETFFTLLKDLREIRMARKSEIVSRVQSRAMSKAEIITPKR